MFSREANRFHVVPFSEIDGKWSFTGQYKFIFRKEAGAFIRAWTFIVINTVSCQASLA